VNVETTLWFFAAFLSFGIFNLLAAAVLLRRRERALGPDAPSEAHSLIRRTLDVLALSLIVVVLSAVMVLDVQLVVPSAPAVGRPALALIVSLIIGVLGRLFALLPNTPRWLPRFLRVFETALLALAVLGFLLAVLLPPRLT
jgi:hypothetical protein